MPEDFPYVKDDVSPLLFEEQINEGDVQGIKALRFAGVYTGKMVIAAISVIDEIDPELEKLDVNLMDRRPPGTHAYEIRLANNRVYSCTIWEKYIPHQ